MEGGGQRSQVVSYADPVENAQVPARLRVVRNGFSNIVVVQ